MPIWFHHKQRGIGVTPAAPEGWVVLALFVTALVGGRLVLDASGRDVDTTYVLLMGALAMGFGVLVWRTTGPRP